MNKLFWCFLCLGAYLWVLTSGNDQFILDRGKALVQTIVQWFDDAETDFQFKNVKPKKKSRRWD